MKVSKKCLRTSVPICSKPLREIRNLSDLSQMLWDTKCITVIKILGSSHVGDADDIVQISLIKL